MVQPHHLKLETRNSKLSASLCLCISVVNCLFAQEPREYFIRQQTASRCEAQKIASRFQQTILYEVGDHCVVAIDRRLPKLCLQRSERHAAVQPQSQEERLLEGSPRINQGARRQQLFCASSDAVRR